MAVTITMPKLGLTMNSGSVEEWKKNIGDPVKKGEILYVVATDKLTVDVESPADGVLLAITIKPGEEVPVGETVGVIGQPGEKVDAASSTAPDGAPASTDSFSPSVAPVATPASARVSRSGHAPSSPKAKKVAREKGVDLAAVTGTGPNGWIVAKDVLNVETAGPKASPLAAKMAREADIDLAGLASGGVAGSRIMKADVAAVMAPASSAVPAGGERRIPITQMRRVIGERMLGSTTSIPSVHYFVDADMTALNAMRANCNVRLAKKAEPVKVSVNDILMKFCAKLLLECPLLNGCVEKDAFVMHDHVNIGFAVALPGGLLVPNIKNVQSKGLEAIGRERAALVDQARGGGLSPDSMSGGTFTISNIGMMGVNAFTPIINPPEVAILGVGATREIPVVRNGEIMIRPVATLCLAADHRLVDGADAAEFISRLLELIEDPELFLL